MISGLILAGTEQAKPPSDAFSYFLITEVGSIKKF